MSDAASRDGSNAPRPGRPALGGFQRDASGALKLPKSVDETTHELCELYAADARKRSPMVKHVLKAIKERGCTLPHNFVHCTPCEGTPIAGGFVADKGEEKVVLCEEVASRSVVRRTLVHELIHAYDTCRAELDPGNIYHVACTEVRAANLSTDCSFTTELYRMGGPFSIRNHQRECVQRRAVLSVKHNPALGDKDPKEVVASIFERCYRDTAPFPDVP